MNPVSLPTCDLKLTPAQGLNFSKVETFAFWFLTLSLGNEIRC